jgi:hypothetical protein
LAALRAQREAEEIMHQLAIDTLHATRQQLMMNHNNTNHVASSISSSTVPVSAFAHLNDDNRFTNLSASSPSTSTTSTTWQQSNNNGNQYNGGHVDINRNIHGGLMSTVPRMASLPPLPPIPNHTNNYQ